MCLFNSVHTIRAGSKQVEIPQKQKSNLIDISLKHETSCRRSHDITDDMQTRVRQGAVKRKKGPHTKPNALLDLAQTCQF